MEIELAIFEDCSALINNFVDSSNPSFKIFCQQWLKAKFQYMYGVQTTAIEVIQTTKAILHFAKRIVCPSNEFGKLANVINNEREVRRRIGGIYLIYAIYFKQPTYRFVKLLMSRETWQEFTNFIQNLPENSISDEVKYIFWNLYKEDAFRFTCSDYDFGLENMVDYDRLYDIHNGNKCVDVVRENLRQKLIIVKEAERILPSMILLEDQYNNSKASLLTANKLGVALPPTNIFHAISDAIKSVHDTLGDKSNEDNVTTAKCNRNINEKRKELKRKAVGYFTNDESSEEEKSEEAKRKKQHWSVRRMIDQQLPESITADLIHYSTDEEE